MVADRMGLLGLALFVIAVMGLWTFLLAKVTVKYRNNTIAQAASQFWPGL